VTGGRSELEPAVDAGVIAVGGDRIRFVHPLFASAIRRQAGAGQLQKIHRKLAEHAVSAEERALNLALAASAPDERAAADLVEAARAARARGAPIASAAFFVHALRLSTPGSPDRVSWEVELAEASFEAGDATRAIELLAELAERLPPGNARAGVLWRLAAISGELGAPTTTIGYYEEALQEVENNPALETRIHSDLVVMWIFANDVQRALVHGRRAVELSELLDDAEVKAEALASLAYVEFTAGLTLRPELIESALTLERMSRRVRIDRSPSVVRGFQLLWTGELAEARSYFERGRRLALQRGDESNLSISGYYLAMLETIAGNWDTAAAHVLEAVELAEHTGVNWLETTYARALLDAHLGRAEPAVSAAREILRRGEEEDHAITVVRSLAVLGFVELSRGDVREAERQLARATDLATTLGIGEPGLLRFVPDHVEALVALGRVEEALRVLHPFEAAAARLGRNWAVAAAGRCRGLALGASGDRAGAVAALERARDGHHVTEMPFELGRTLLVLGAAQRRAKQRRAARESLDEAIALFERLGAPLWAAKTRAELGRIAGRAPASEGLTPAEARIAERVARGLTNREVAAELVIEVHTVEAALTRIYGKLGVRSRAQLVRRSAEDAR
jgi:DNA-binding CsgD family transcriptional regulator